MNEEETVYELGYLLTPLVPEEKLAEEVAQIRAAIEAHGGAMTEEFQPRMRPLAYPISQTLAHARSSFEQAYFGWIHFRALPEKVSPIEADLKKSERILRFLLIHAIPASKTTPRRSERPYPAAPRPSPVEAEKEKGAMDVTEVDREIEHMIQA